MKGFSVENWEEWERVYLEVARWEEKTGKRQYLSCKRWNDLPGLVGEQVTDYFCCLFYPRQKSSLV